MSYSEANRSMAVAGLVRGTCGSAYYASKHGVIGLTEAAAIEYGCLAFGLTRYIRELSELKWRSDFSMTIRQERALSPPRIRWADWAARMRQHAQ